MEETSSSEMYTRLDASIRPYHVFINHRGPDVKDTFASTIDFSLRDKGLNVFFDKTEFQSGQRLLPTITEAIRSSSVYIAIFSPRYAESPWCLEELRLMIECDRKIIPVFYHVRPQDLKRQQTGKGVYAKDLKELENKADAYEITYDRRTVLQWREALKQACNISGLEFDSKSFNGNQGKLVETIVVNAMEYVRMERLNITDKGLVGLDDAIEDFKFFLSKCSNQSDQSAFQVVGIVGTAGSGKTTLAEEFYYRRRVLFDRSSLLFGVRKACERNGLQSLQKQLLKDLTNDRSVEINNVSEGRDILADRIHRLCHERSLRFLSVIDDVDHREQLDALLLKDCALGSGSCVIVTSRGKAILSFSRISLQYEMKPLSRDDARTLFTTHVFHKSEIMSGFEGLVESALNKCGGLPLFIKFMGEHLHLNGNNNREYWENQLEMISQIPDIVHACYGTLGEEEKQIFLDIACLFVGKDRNSAIRIWAGSGWRFVRALQKLEYLSLVETDAKNRLKMHHYLCNLGQHIADQQFYNTPHLSNRLWRPNDAANYFGNLLPLPERTKCRVATSTSYHGRNGRERLKLEILDVNGDLPNAKTSEKLKDLIWFRWKNCPKQSLPLVEMKNLRVLELVKGNLKMLWDPNPTFQLPAQLRELNIKKCTRFSTMTPRIESVKLLEKMTLDGSLGLKSLPNEVCKLKSLRYLELKGCKGLTSLPSLFGELTNLQHLDLSGCQQLSSLPPSFGQLIQMKTLDVRNCRNLIIQENIFGEIRTIEELNFENCKKLHKLPYQTTLQRLLKRLNLLGTNIDELPENFHHLIGLQQMQIGSPLLTNIPPPLKNMPNLMELQMINCRQLISYPESIGRLRLRFSNTSPMETTGAMKYVP
ncbi:hypothetical protein SUGI_0689110 [Cryptomeria japonica]|uniref:disease resistance protein RUN1-like n=1 Tax=Cryptomeria japonica TaxID=3369 RepID=UPI002414A877|nr:disease resistance protein RUN1-like [Cryptomeria japonica]GLJ34290.1 hypothetical protein SUGI_0689110 [Cryptomeria japonica]